MKALFVFLLLSTTTLVWSQELFVITDPASNVPAGSLSVRLSNSLFKEVFEPGYNYHLMPEITYGVNKNLMIRTSAFISNRSNSLYGEGANIFAKYRFYSMDDIHSHLRMAVFARYSLNRADIHQEQIEIMGHNTGFEAGAVITQLVHKVAISSSASIEKATDNNPNYEFPDIQGNTAANYTLSVGKLMYPKTYKTFKETNINLMLELAGQTITENGKTYLDAVPSIQFIFNSQSRIDIGYRRELYSNMIRTAPNGLYLNLEYTFFNVGAK
jgi:hypothetical protein